MERYFFHLHECGTLIADEEGRELADIGVARDEAVTAARSIMADEVLSGSLCLSCCIKVKDLKGDVVLTIPFSEAVTITGR